MFSIRSWQIRRELAIWSGIHTHLVRTEIPGFDLPDRFFGLTSSLFSRDGIIERLTILNEPSFVAMVAENQTWVNGMQVSWATN